MSITWLKYFGLWGKICQPKVDFHCRPFSVLLDGMVYRVAASRCPLDWLENRVRKFDGKDDSGIGANDKLLLDANKWHLNTETTDPKVSSDKLRRIRQTVYAVLIRNVVWQSLDGKSSPPVNRIQIGNIWDKHLMWSSPCVFISCDKSDTKFEVVSLFEALSTLLRERTINIV